MKDPASKKSSASKPFGQKLEAVALILIGIALFMSFPALLLFITSYADRSESQHSGCWILPILLVVAVFYRYGLAIAGYQLVFEGRKAWESARRNDSSRIVLYLRSFHVDGQAFVPWYGSHKADPGRNFLARSDNDKAEADAAAIRSVSREFHQALYGKDGVKHIASVWGQTHEQQVAFATRRVGELMKLDNAEEVEPGLGALRLRVPTAKWRENVIMLIGAARLIVIQGGDTQSLLWELEQVRRLAKPENVLIVFPADFLGHSLEFYERVRSRIESAFQVVIPVSREIPIVIGFRRNWEAELIYNTTPVILRALFLGGWSGTSAALARALRSRGLPFRWLPPPGMTFLGLVRLTFLCLVAAGAAGAIRSCAG